MSLPEAIRGFLPKTVSFALRDPKRNYPLIGAEQDAISNAIAKRKTEFSAGRDAARDALVQLGEGAVEIPVGLKRAPIWPDGINGSITHSNEMCMAIAARNMDARSVGIDAEKDEPLKDDLRSAILHDSELNVSSFDATRLFSMKEALFKALFPLCGEFFGFHAAKSDGASGLILTRKLGEFAPGTTFDVPTLHHSGHVISHCVVANAAI